MPFTLKPEYLQTIHYYFFALGMFSLVSAATFSDLSVYSYLFIGFYGTHSAVSWYVSWAMHRSMREVIVINSGRYALSHIVLTVWSAALAVLMWFLFDVNYEYLMFSLISVNFFALFLAGLWLALARMRLLQRFVSWQDRKQLDASREAVAEFRRKAKLYLVDDDMLLGYAWGSDRRIDGLFGDAARLNQAGDRKGFAGKVRELEIAICEMRMRELEEEIRVLGTPAGDEERQLLKHYQELSVTYRRRIVEYEKEFARFKA